MTVRLLLFHVEEMVDIDRVKLDFIILVDNQRPEIMLAHQCIAFQKRQKLILSLIQLLLFIG